jgi:hypothetical protein
LRIVCYGAKTTVDRDKILNPLTAKPIYDFGVCHEFDSSAKGITNGASQQATADSVSDRQI